MAKRKYYCCYDYGMGGIWFVIYAHSKAEITKKYPFLFVRAKEPSWMKPKDNKDKDTLELKARIREKFTFDISDRPPLHFLLIALEEKLYPYETSQKKS